MRKGGLIATRLGGWCNYAALTRLISTRPVLGDLPCPLGFLNTWNVFVEKGNYQDTNRRLGLETLPFMVTGTRYEFREYPAEVIGSCPAGDRWLPVRLEISLNITEGCQLSRLALPATRRTDWGLFAFLKSPRLLVVRTWFHPSSARPKGCLYDTFNAN